jgi:DNA helicase-2/ATP-dependent DNA helicase PcrA
MPESGRSQPAVIDLANRLIEWVISEHPVIEARSALSPPFIRPAPPGDPQPNPPVDWSAIRLVTRKLSPEEEVSAVVESLSRWVPSHPDSTVAVLVPRNARGVEVIEGLKRRGVDYLEFLASTSSTRAAAGALSNLIAYLADPQSAVKLAKAYQVWRRDWREQASSIPYQAGEEAPQVDQKAVSARRSLMGTVGSLLRKLIAVESFIAPNPENDWLSGLGEPQPVFDELAAFRGHVARWLEAVTLPIDQLVLTLAQDVFTSAADLALSQKLASVLRTAAEDHPEWRLPELTAELAVIARNERRFIGFSVEDTGFDPDRHRGRVVVTTMHKAKGLEWDRVYLMSVNSYDFPSNQANDRYIAEKWFVRDRLNLEAEALAQLDQALADPPHGFYTEGSPTRAARLDYVRERLRLLYVGITRARRELIVTWNTGRQGDATPALPLSALMGWMQQITDQDAP